VSAADVIAARIAGHLQPGDIVNLGIGIPTRVADFLDGTPPVYLHTENGLLGVGPTPTPGLENPALVNAAKAPVTTRPGAAFFSSAESFAMIRGHHVDVAVLGALQVDARGRIASWALPGQPILGVGGAMDLLVGAKRVIVAMTHLTRDDEPKLVAECTFPLTGDRPADLIVTEHATFAVRDGGLVLTEVVPGTTDAWIHTHTHSPFTTEVLT
jgi:3-oxoacid CoA-transferase B subunit